MSAGLAMLHHLRENPSVYDRLEEIGNQLVTGFRDNLRQLGLDFTINHIGSMFSIFTTSQPVIDIESAKTSDLALFGKYFQAMLRRGVYLAPSQFESLFLSTALTDEHIRHIIQANRESLEEALVLK
jgi:glutamate-1-semialdehyde 2,1-aminomutase